MGVPLNCMVPSIQIFLKAYYIRVSNAIKPYKFSRKTEITNFDLEFVIKEDVVVI